MARTCPRRAVAQRVPRVRCDQLAHHADESGARAHRRRADEMSALFPGCSCGLDVEVVNDLHVVAGEADRDHDDRASRRGPDRVAYVGTEPRRARAPRAALPHELPRLDAGALGREPGGLGDMVHVGAVLCHRHGDAVRTEEHFDRLQCRPTGPRGHRRCRHPPREEPPCTLQTSSAMARWDAQGPTQPGWL